VIRGFTDPSHVDDAETTEYVHALTGATVELRCTVGGSALTGVQWQRDGDDELMMGSSSGSRFRLLTEHELDIVDVQLDDAGQYTCRARNEFGDVKSKRFVVQVVGGYPACGAVQCRGHFEGNATERRSHCGKAAGTQRNDVPAKFSVKEE